MGSCQNYGPFLGTLNNRCRTIIGTQQGTIILTTTQIARTLKPSSLGVSSPKPYLCTSLKAGICIHFTPGHMSGLDEAEIPGPKNPLEEPEPPPDDEAPGRCLISV